jgi:hypothetical protein
MSSAYNGRAFVPKTGVVSQRYARPIAHDGIIMERVFSSLETLFSGS